MKTKSILVTVAVLAAASSAFAQRVVRYAPLEKELKFVYAAAPPVATLQPGDTLETNTFDAFGNVDKRSNTATYHAVDSNFSVTIPLRPFLGCIGVAPAGGEARASTVPAEFGGNMDAPEVRPGYTLYLPVNVPGALLYIGDGHAAQGDGEIAGTAIEVPLRVRLQVQLLKRKKIGWPRFETDTSLMAVGAYRPVDDALRIAFTELVAWIHADYGLSELDTYELLSKVATIHLVEMVDPNYVVIAGVEKRYLPGNSRR